MKSLEIQQERKFCQLGFEYLKGGAPRYRIALQKLHMQSKTERPYYSSDMGPFYQWLRECYDAPSLKPMVDLTCAHIFETYPTSIEKEVFGQLPSKQNWFTMRDASKLTGFGVVFLKKLLGHMNGVGESDALKRTDVHVDELDSAKSYWSSLMTLKEASQSFGLPVRQIKALQDRGVLDTIKVTSSLRYAKQEQVATLLRKVTSLPVAREGQALVPLKAFCRDKGVGIPRLIELWANVELEGALFRGEVGTGFQAMEVAWDAMCAIDRVQFNRDLQLSEVARYLQISVISVRQLRNHGYLSQLKKRNVDTNRIKSYISKESILAFEETYVTLGQMSAKQKIAPIHLARKLDDNDIPPISCGGEYVRVYEKSAVGWEA
ncbi:hypothetical protein [Cognatishimia sp. WU-CL00825]|uniref:hypothetical protein n=1 Tax=Cognatishimia sp. WU-CL00825 TaxID=3127658 RepID=UPI0033654A4C